MYLRFAGGAAGGDDGTSASSSSEMICDESRSLFADRVRDLVRGVLALFASLSSSESGLKLGRPAKPNLLDADILPASLSFPTLGFGPGFPFVMPFVFDLGVPLNFAAVFFALVDVDFLVVEAAGRGGLKGLGGIGGGMDCVIGYGCCQNWSGFKVQTQVMRFEMQEQSGWWGGGEVRKL